MLEQKVNQTPEEMYSRRINGETLEQIARDNGVTRERIRQIIEKYEEEQGLLSAYEVARIKIAKKAEEAIAAKAMRKQVSQEYRMEVENNILKLSAEGFTEAEITETLGIQRGLASRVLLAYRGTVKTERQNISEDTIEIMYRMSQQGMSQGEIGKVLGYNQSVVSHALRRRENKIQQKQGSWIEQESKKNEGPSQEIIQKMYQMSLEGKSQRIIGEQLGYTQPQVSQILIAYRKAIATNDA